MKTVILSLNVRVFKKTFYTKSKACFLRTTVYVSSPSEWNRYTIQTYHKCALPHFLRIFVMFYNSYYCYKLCALDNTDVVKTLGVSNS